MKIFQKIKLQRDQEIVKKYKVVGITLLREEKTATKKKWNFLGFRFSKKKKSFSRLFPKEAENKVYKGVSHVPSPKRVAIFASFSKNGKIADYVVYYLSELKKVCDAIVFVADNPIIPSEVDKIKNLVVYAQFKRHKEYDFGSYKRGFQRAQKSGLLANAEELVLCNDSCFGPVFPFTEMFDKMADDKADFWGLSNYDQHYHIQSFFVVLKKKVFNSDVFAKFIFSVQKENSFWDVVLKYELGLSDILHEAGFISASVVPKKIAEMQEYSKAYSCYNKTFFPTLLMEKYRFPLIKTKVFNGDRAYLTLCLDDRTELLEKIKMNNNELYNCIHKYIQALSQQNTVKKQK